MVKKSKSQFRHIQIRMGIPKPGGDFVKSNSSHKLANCEFACDVFAAELSGEQSGVIAINGLLKKMVK